MLEIMSVGYEEKHPGLKKKKLYNKEKEWLRAVVAIFVANFPINPS